MLILYIMDMYSAFVFFLEICNKMKQTIFTIFLSIFVSVSIASEVKGDINSGKRKVAMCIGCHGIPNYKSTFPEVYRVPKIGGQAQEYLISALNAYKNGERNHPSMMGIAGSMTEQDIADVAAYYANQK